MLPGQEQNVHKFRGTLFFSKRFSLCLIISLYSPVFPDVDDGSILHKGEATFYGEGSFGHCGFPVDSQPYYHGAMNHTDYDFSSACGTWVHITGPKGEVTAFIDDECPECKEGDIDLGPNTFEVIADKHLGRVPIFWRYVPAPVKGPIRYFWKDGTSRYHIEIQVRNHRYGITRLEIQTQTSDWKIVDRYPYNFFKLYGGINGEDGPYNIRITDIFGNQIVDSMIPLIPASVVEGKSNFPEITNAIHYRNITKKSSEKTMMIKTVSFTGKKIVVALPYTGSVTLYSLQGQRIGTFTSDVNGYITFPQGREFNHLLILKSP